MSRLVLYKSYFKWVVCIVALTSCSFNFELTSQKTALENQIMGSYKELDDEVLLSASVRGVGADGKKKETKIQSDAAKVALNAKQNQSFNRDDIDELKEKQILGELKGGDLGLLPKGVGLVDAADPNDIKLAKFLISQENRDRDLIVKRIVSTNSALTEKDFGEAKKVYRKTILDESPLGTWIESDSGAWNRKSDIGKAQEISKAPEKAKI